MHTTTTARHWSGQAGIGPSLWRSLILIAVAIAILLLAAGCDAAWGRRRDTVKPTVAVMKFENRAPFPMNWDLGGGMQEILVHELMETERFQVVERAELGHVLAEQRLQASGATRPQGRADVGRIKNCQYLIKGTVTDFGHVASDAGAFSGLFWNIFGGSDRAVMGVILYVVDVESGEIVASESIEKTVRAGDASVQATYGQVAFGGSTFRQTPLGRATADVVETAVDRISDAVADRPWRPLIAQVASDGTVVLNGGTNHGLQQGAEFTVVEAGKPILDPASGDLLGRGPGRQVGRVIVHEIHDGWARATIVVGTKEAFRPGQHCLACL